LSICLELADLVDKSGESGQEVYNKELGIGYRVLSGYLRNGVKEVIDLQAKYHSAIASKNLAEIGQLWNILCPRSAIDDEEADVLANLWCCQTHTTRLAKRKPHIIH
jgi:hypothetical protein